MPASDAHPHAHHHRTAARLADGRWIDGASTHDEAVAVRAACDCGWASSRAHDLPPRPPEGISERQRAAWQTERDQLFGLCALDWQINHLAA